MKINYMSVFDAYKGNRAIEKYTDRKFERDHVQGRTIFEMNSEEIKILRKYKVRFIKE